jgi:hypothetical protein
VIASSTTQRSNILFGNTLGTLLFPLFTSPSALHIEYLNDLVDATGAEALRKKMEMI